MDAARACLPEHARDAPAILDRDGNHVDLACNPVLDQLVLPGGVEAGRAVPDQVDAKLPRGFLGARTAADEVRIAFGFRHHGNHGPPRRRRCRGCVRRRSCDRTERPDQPHVRAGHEQRARDDRAAEHGDLAVLHRNLLLMQNRSRHDRRVPAETIDRDRHDEQRTRQDARQLRGQRRKMQTVSQNRQRG